jgi:hypothetical protein
MTADCLRTERRLELMPTYLGTHLVHAAVTPEHYHPSQGLSLMLSRTAAYRGIKLESSVLLALH